MSEISTACDCAIGSCEQHAEQEACVRFLARSGSVYLQWCDYCATETWHQNGACLKIVSPESGD